MIGCEIMPCNPNCSYFHNNERNIKYKRDKFGVKYFTSKLECEFDNSIIKSWDRECPKEKNEENNK
jgi:hypothetical protein